MFKVANFTERLSIWKSFRKSLNYLPLNEACNKTFEFWKSCPYVPYYLCIDDLKSWPDPWQLIFDNYYCDLAKTLGIIYTLYLTSHCSKLYPEIRIYVDPVSNHTFNIAYFSHGKYVLNLVDDVVVNKEHVPNNYKLKFRFTAEDLKLKQY